MRWIVAIFFCLLAACRHPAYYLTRQGRTQILTPPPSKPEIKNVRNHPAEKTGCDIEGDSFSLVWRGNTAHLTVNTEAYFAPEESSREQLKPQAVNIAVSGPRMYADSLAQLEKFREALTAREERGCLRHDEGARLKVATTETFPFPPQIAAYLVFGTYPQTGFIDLMPGYILRLVSPGNAEPEVSFYEIKRASGEDRMRIKLTSGTGKSLSVPQTPAYFRYLYWTGASAHNFRATILGAPSREALHAATGQFLSDPETFCEKPAFDLFCQSIAVSVGMNAGFDVRVNGREVFVRIGGTIGEVIGEMNNGFRVAVRPQALPQNVTVHRMFHGRLIPVKVDGSPNDIYGLVAMPGDEITF